MPAAGFASGLLLAALQGARVAIALPEEDPLHRCGMECADRGFCCNNPSVGMNRMISCSQACLIRARGLDEATCQRECQKRRGCRTEIGGHQYHLCGECDDLTDDPKCQSGVASRAACVDGCSIEPLPEGGAFRTEKNCIDHCRGEASSCNDLEAVVGNTAVCSQACTDRLHGVSLKACVFRCLRNGSGCARGGLEYNLHGNCSELVEDVPNVCGVGSHVACISGCLM